LIKKVFWLVVGVVKKCGLLKIIHDKHKNPGRVVHPCITEFLGSFEHVKEHNKAIEGLLSKTQVKCLHWTLERVNQL